ncbi:MAG: hypothetical protein PWR20_1228 [Bacteroidales bacterium]|jgi:hypothetical protein|nr:hypothetical protein [Bacteroidales bacterium]MDN5329372.1 hypothetical protein [Bacteroidales bacterium]
MIDHLYRALADFLLDIKDSNNEPLIRHVALWNRQVDFLETEGTFATPAVFVQFLPMQWHQLSQGVEEAQLQLVLHLACTTKASAKSTDQFKDAALQRFYLLANLHKSFVSFTRSGPSWMAGNPERLSLDIDHDHGELTDDRMTYRLPVADATACTHADWISKLIHPQAQGSFRPPV